MLAVFGLASALGCFAPDAVHSSDLDPTETRLLLRLREAMGMGGDTQMSLSRPRPAAIPGFTRYLLRVGEGERAQEIPLHLHDDGQHYFVGSLQEISVERDAEARKRLSLKGAMARGPESAPVTVVMYADPFCGYCKRAYSSLKNELPAYGKKVRWIYKQYPLGGSEAASWGPITNIECAREQGNEAGWGMMDRLYGRGDELTEENLDLKLAEFRRELKLDEKRFQKCLDSPELAEKIAAEAEVGRELGVRGTPAFFINGHHLSGFGGFGSVRALIDEMLAGTHPSLGNIGPRFDEKPPEAAPAP